MTTHRLFLVVALLVGFTAVSRQAAADPPPSPHGSGGYPTLDKPARTGVVRETFASGGYRYALLQTDTGDVWVAGPDGIEVRTGDTVVTSQGSLIANFESRTLGRTFDRIWFVARLEVAQLPDGSQWVTAPKAAVQAPTSSAGLSVAALHAQARSLAGQRVTVRGTVVKFTPQVQQRNWIHLQDGTGEDARGTHDLTVTTQERAEVGEEVVIEGVVAVDRDYGFGYHYPVIIEHASVRRD